MSEIIQGDVIDFLRSANRGEVDLIFADPPFNIGYEYDSYVDDLAPGDYDIWCRNWLYQSYMALKPDGTLWLAIGDEYAAELCVAAKQNRFHLRSWVIWYYTFGVNCKNGFTRSHTHLLHFVKDRGRFTFNKDRIHVPSARQAVYKDRRANPKGRIPDNSWILRPQQLPGPLPVDHDFWHVPRVCGTHKERQGWHPCQMPEAVLERIILVSSNEGDLVVDPFCGSGTTGIVAKRLTRRFRGCELSADYAQRASERLGTVGDAA